MAEIVICAMYIVGGLSGGTAMGVTLHFVPQVPERFKAYAAVGFFTCGAFGTFQEIAKMRSFKPESATGPCSMVAVATTGATSAFWGLLLGASVDQGRAFGAMCLSGLVLISRVGPALTKRDAELRKK
jgi:hypothetical protein